MYHMLTYYQYLDCLTAHVPLFQVNFHLFESVLLIAVIFQYYFNILMIVVFPIYFYFTNKLPIKKNKWQHQTFVDAFYSLGLVLGDFLSQIKHFTGGKSCSQRQRNNNALDEHNYSYKINYKNNKISYKFNLI